jgi:hypothetical protein
MSGAIQVRWSQGQEVCQNRSAAFARNLLYGSSNSTTSPMKLGRDPVGSPTKIALVSRSMAVAVFCAAE